MLETSLYCSRFLLPINSPPLEDGALLVHQGRIVSVGSRSHLVSHYPEAQIVDFQDKVILPPMANVHTHLELTHYPIWANGLKDQSDNVDFTDWILRLVNIKRRLDLAEVIASLKDGISESLRSGTVLVGDILSVLPAVSAYCNSPLRGRIFFEVLGQNDQQLSERLKNIAEIKPPKGDHVTLGLSPHAPYTLSRTTFQKTVEYAISKNWPLAMHLAETAAEAEFIKNNTGPIADHLYKAAGWEAMQGKSTAKTPVQWALESVGLPAGSLAIHAVHVTAEDISHIAKNKLSVVLCPRSNAYFGCKKAPVLLYEKANVPFALGTDSRASVKSLSIWDEMAFAYRWFSGMLDPDRWLVAATQAGSGMLGMGQSIGCLAAGYEATFQVVDIPDGAVLPSLSEALCAHGDRVNVNAVYIGGEFLEF